MRNRTFHILRSGCVTALLIGFSWSFSIDAGAADKPEPGLSVKFTASDGNKSKASDLVVLTNLSLYVPAGQSPTPFLSGGNFSADWTGFIASEIRDNYTFIAELSGEVKVSSSVLVASTPRTPPLMNGAPLLCSVVTIPLATATVESCALPFPLIATVA